jgi:hypothetical protein
MGRKHEKGEFCRHPCNHVSVVTVARNRPGKLKLWAMAHENGCRKHEEYEFSWSLSNHESVVMVTGYCPGNQKMYAIAHENAQKTLKIWVLAMPVKSCIDGHSHWKSSWKPKTERYSSWKWAENMKIGKFWWHPFNHVSGLTVTGNHPGKLKLWAMAHENGCSKHEKHEFS